VVSPERTSIGKTVKGTVTLNRAADAGGVRVVLSTDRSSSIAKIEPSTTLTMAAGTTTATFDVRAFGEVGSEKIKSATVVIVEAKIDGVGKAAALTIEP
jgi:hypothetical protein